MFLNVKTIELINQIHARESESNHGRLPNEPGGLVFLLIILSLDLGLYINFKNISFIHKYFIYSFNYFP